MNCCVECTWLRGKKPKLVEKTLIQCEQICKIEKPHYTSTSEWCAKYKGDPKNAKQRCTKYSCYQHQNQCNDCGKQVCFDCRKVCQHCSKDLCQNCTWDCDKCDADICRYCLNNEFEYHGGESE